MNHYDKRDTILTTVEGAVGGAKLDRNQPEKCKIFDRIVHDAPVWNTVGTFQRKTFAFRQKKKKDYDRNA